MKNEPAHRVVDLSLILPLFQEAEHIRASLREIDRTLSASSLRSEILLFDDASTDETVSIVMEELPKYPTMRLLRHERNAGRGQTVQDGIRASSGAVVGYIDVDLEVSPAHIAQFSKIILDGEADVVTGERIYRTSFRSWSRYLSNVSYRTLVRFLLRLPFRDTETGYKFFRREALFPLLDRATDPGWFWDTEIMAESYRAGLRVRELPVLFTRRYDKSSTVRLVRDSVEYVRKLLAFRRRWTPHP